MSKASWTSLPLRSKLIVYPNGYVECRSSFLKESASIIINISKRNWKTVANTIFKHEEIKAELLGPITKAVDAEFTDYRLRKHRRKWGTFLTRNFWRNETSCLLVIKENV